MSVAGDAAPQAYVSDGELRLEQGVDPSAIGAAVTAELCGHCGHWEHTGPCHWPHNNAIVAAGPNYRFRTIFIAPSGEEAEVRTRIDRAIRGAVGVTVVGISPRPVASSEQALSERLRRAMG